MISYATNRRMLSQEGKLVLPFVINLVQYCRICGVTQRSDVLYGLFETAQSQKTDTDPLTLHRPKRIPLIPVIAAGAGLATLAWVRYEYSEIKGKIDEITADENQRFHYLKSQILRSQTDNWQNSLVLRRELTQMSVLAAQKSYTVEQNITRLIFETKLMAEFDDIVSALRTERLTTEILPPSQAGELVATVPSLHDTVYRDSPSLLYYTVKF